LYPRVALPLGTYTPYNAQATVHLSPSFFALLLPFTVHGRVSDIWRSYIAQTLFTYIEVPTNPFESKNSQAGPSSNDSTLVSDSVEANVIQSWFDQSSPENAGPCPAKLKQDTITPCLVFTPPHIYHDRNSHKYTRDFNSEHPLYDKAEPLVAFLTDRQRGGVSDLYERVQAAKSQSNDESPITIYDLMYVLYIDLYEVGILEKAELQYVYAWAIDLQRIPNVPQVKLMPGVATSSCPQSADRNAMDA
jgi:hypothetical protein